MKPLLHHWILPSQTGFVPNRCILDNIFLAFEAIKWTLESKSKHELSMILLDFEKAYDRVNWTFLKQVMEKMGFDSTWIHQVMSLNLNATASVIVNGEQSKNFRLQRSVRQGCPLAPYLFLLTVDVLGQMLQHPECQVQGLRLPDDITITNQMFADDTLLFLDGTRDNLDRALQVINRFGAASGAKLNLHKSIGLWLAQNERQWHWGEEAGLKWLQPGEVTHYLGYPFGLHIPQRVKDEKMMGQIRKHLLRWAGSKLFLAGRIMVCNQVVLSSIWYLTSCADIFGHAFKLARATVRNYMWSGKRESRARARVKWDTAVLPIVRGGVKILDPQWQASALLVKLLIRRLSVGYEPWKVLVRYRVAQTKQSRRGRWPAHANWVMNAPNLAKQGSPMWQGVMKAWHTIQSGIEQQDPSSWAEIARQPLFGNRFLTDTSGIQWGTHPRSNMRWWAENGVRNLKDLARPNGEGWQTFAELKRLRRTSVAPHLYARLVSGIPWNNAPAPAPRVVQWLAPKSEAGRIETVYHVRSTNPVAAPLYRKEATEQLKLMDQQLPLPSSTLEDVRIVRTGGPRRVVIDFNPYVDPKEEQATWLWGDEWVSNLAWDPKEWVWRRIGMLAEAPNFDYTTKRGYRVALRQNNHTMDVDEELAAAGFHSKVRAKFFNRIWHPHLPRKVSAMQWLILTKGLPVGAWRERIGLPNACQLCPTQDRETLQHAFLECSEVKEAWELFRRTRWITCFQPAYHTWLDISRGLMTDIPGPSVEEELCWDPAAAFSINSETPWDILRAQLLWALWCQRVTHAFSEDNFHLGVVHWTAWRNTVYCVMEAFKELLRQKRNEAKKQELLSCFQSVWTHANIFGRSNGADIKWNLTPHKEFLLPELAAWNSTPIRIHRLSPSPDIEAEFAARSDFGNVIDDFLRDAGRNWRPPEDEDQGNVRDPERAPDLTPTSPLPVPEERSTPERSSHLQSTGTPQARENTQFQSAREDREGECTSGQASAQRPPLAMRHKQRCPSRLNHPSRRLIRSTHAAKDFTSTPGTSVPSEVQHSECT